MVDKHTVTYRVVAAIIAIIVVAYTVFHMISLFSAELSTVVVGTSTEETKLEFDGYIFRDETVVESASGGAVDYIAYDGLKLATGEKLAVVYQQGNTSTVDRNIDELDAMISVIEQGVSKDLTLSDIPKISSKLDEEHYSIMSKLANGDIREISKNIDSMTAELCKRSVLTNDKSPVPETLKNLYAERERLMAAGGDSMTLTANKSGYFYSGVDGYENIFTFAAAEKMTPELYQKYISADPEPQVTGKYPIGKMVYDPKWAFITMLNNSDAEKFEVGDSYEMTFTGGESVSMPLTLIDAVKDENSPMTLLRFECDRMPSGFDFSRAQSVEVVVERVTGITVPKSATHKSNGFLYVYILKGSVVFERRIDVIYEGSDYYTVADGLDPDGEDIYLQSNDTLILDGQNLFDGRILD